MVGMRVCVDDRVDEADLRRKKLGTDVGSGVDKHARRPGPAIVTLEQQRAARATVSRLIGVAGTPVVADARHTRRGATAEDGRPQHRAHGRGTLLKSRWKLAVVAAASASGVMPRTSASILAVSTT